MGKFSSSACLFSAILMVSCAEDGSPLLDPMPELDDGEGGISSPAPGADPSGGPQPLSQYNGSYLQSCSANATLDAYSTILVSIQDDTLTLSEQGYSDAACTQPANLLQTTHSLVYPGGTTTTAAGDADHLDKTLEGVIINSLPATSAQLQNLATEGAFDTDYTLIFLDGASLFTGLNTAELDGSSAATRPTELAPNFAVRQ